MSEWEVKPLALMPGTYIGNGYLHVAPFGGVGFHMTLL